MGKIKSINYWYHRARWFLFSRISFKKNYQVYGFVRRVALEDSLIDYGDKTYKGRLSSASLESYASIAKIIQKVRPDEIYHLARKVIAILLKMSFLL